jgi:hypothetical protein
MEAGDWWGKVDGLRDWVGEKGAKGIGTHVC